MHRRILAAMVAMVAVPVGVEWLIAYIKDENYQLGRAGIVLGVVVVAAVLVGTLQFMTRRLSLILDIAMVVLGVAITTTGILSLVARSEQRTELAILVVCLGLVLSGVAGYAVVLDRTGGEFALVATRGTSRGSVHHLGDDSAPTTLTKFRACSPSDDEVAELCRPQMNADDLHFVGYYVDNACRFHLDVLDDVRLNRFFRGEGRELRRLQYERAGRQLEWVMSKLNAYARRLDGGILVRTVLDVEQGALYYYWIDRNVYLTGITMNQSKVLVTDEKLRRLANKIGHLPRGGTDQAEPIQQVVGSD
ncbi:MAG: hypothetical protein ACRDSK_29200 [Actinophytocola sp.]|uniref:hypothetical protein n=1 Tax=Actinophytocola sp. TaxID=1872138 RepID=UPI003D6AF5A2